MSDDSRPTEVAQQEQQEPAEMAALVGQLEEGGLSVDDQRRLADLLESMPPQAVMMATRHQAVTYSGPLPPPEQLNGYDEVTRQKIVAMAEKEQDHQHNMNRTGLGGAIAKDKRGQKYGLIVAVFGLVVAGWVAQYSPTAGVFLGSIDLVGMVALFVAPRVLESRRSQSGSGGSDGSAGDE